MGLPRRASGAPRNDKKICQNTHYQFLGFCSPTYRRYFRRRLLEK